MADVRIDYQTLNQIAGSFKNLAVDLAAGETWEDTIADAVRKVWMGEPAIVPTDAVENMIDDWDYVRSVMAIQAMNAAEKADVIGEGYDDWDSGVGVPGETALETGSWHEAGGSS
ncbi:hypothetical protein [uncultured Agrococcus sp.]|uniref:hypothetical protein n=1 Tax=uncultured Agrococcus sp. TaxID=382258 RepID=UPI0025E7612B|nr:hypothetical protein [uncultured Agrococcus sp.]